MNDIKRKRLDNIANQLRYYKRKYGYIINEKEYCEFKKHINIIKKVYYLHDFICSVNQYKIPYECVEMYAKNYNILQEGFSIKPYLLKLKKVCNLKKISNEKTNEIKVKFKLDFS